MIELEKIKQKIKQDPNFINSKEFANWKDKNDAKLSINQLSEIFESLPKNFNIDLSILFENQNNEQIIEDSISAIQRKRNVGYNAAKEIYRDKQDKLYNIINILTPTLETITKDLVKQNDFVNLVKSVIPDESLQNANNEELESLILGYYHNTCRGYIVKTLTLKYLYETFYNYSNMFLDEYWQDKLHKN